MALQLYDVRIAGIRSLTEDAKEISFDIPSHLSEVFQYIPGQYLTIEIEVAGKKQRRAYSLCSSPVLGERHAVGVKRVENGVVSTWLNNTAKEGDIVRLMAPMGNFTHRPEPGLNNHYVLFGGGSGITPLMSIMKSVLLREQASRITLFYANRNERSIMFRAELEELIQRYAGRLRVIYTLDEGSANWQGRVGMIDQANAKSLLDEFITADIFRAHYFICGPSGMMAQVDLALAEKAVDKGHIHKEFFNNPIRIEEHPADVGTVAEEMEVADKPLKSAQLVLTLDGSEHTVDFDGQMSILEAALDGGVDAPYACQVGACCTCRAKLKEGKVHMEDRESLSDKEIEEGYILTCQSTPLTNKLVYSYDD